MLQWSAGGSTGLWKHTGGACKLQCVLPSAYLKTLLVRVFLLALRHEVDHLASFVAPCAAHALNVPDR